MLREFFSSLAATAAPQARRFGFVYELVAIAARARRCRHAWAAHLANSRAAMLAAADACSQHRSVAVLGAGALLDVPLAELAARFRQVVLIDLAHLASTRIAAWRLGNVTLLQRDLSGTLASLADPAATSPAVQAWDWAAGIADLDLTISANLISQLPLLPVAAATQRWKLAPKAQERLGQRIVERHLAQLRALPGTVCLIGDVDRVKTEGAVSEQLDPLFGALVPPGEEWDWELAPPGELARGSLRSRVRSVMLKQG